MNACHECFPYTYLDNIFDLESNHQPPDPPRQPLSEVGCK